MVPTFALSLSFEEIVLLGRAPDGWRKLGEPVPVDDALGAAMADLRAHAESHDPDGPGVLLLLPDEQIRYLDVEDPGPDPDATARAALEGATPYAVAELRIDHAVHGGRLQVAAVAQETLAEAEDFARAHGFSPVAFAALPDPGRFSGTVFFGAAGSWTGPAPDRPDTPPEIGAGPWRPERTERAAPTGSQDPAASTGPKPQTKADEAPSDAGAEADEAPSDAAQGDGPRTDATAAPAPAFTSRRATETTGPPPPPEPAPPSDRPKPEHRPRIHIGQAAAAQADAGDAPAAPQPGKEDAKPASADGATGKTGPTATARARPVAARLAPTPGEQGAAFRQRILDRARDAARDPAGSVPAKPPSGLSGPGGRRPATPRAGKTRSVGLVLTAALLAVLALVAGWSLMDRTEEIARPSGTEAEAEVALADAETPDAAAPTGQDGPVEPAPAPVAPAPQTTAEAPEMSAPSPATEAEREIEQAALDPRPEPPAPAARPQQPAEPDAQAGALPAPLSAEEAAATYAATGIWQRAPEAPARPPVGAVEDLYVASIDPGVQQFDAVALPPAGGFDSNEAPDDPGLPPPAGMEFDMDERGLVRATPEGALSPEGLRVYTGQPPVVPPLRSAALPEPIAPPASDALGGFRPAARPDDLAELRERATLQGLSRAELNALRPVTRPRSAQDDAEAETPEATDEAVARSLLPQTRPEGMARIVASVRQRQAAAPAPAPAPRTVNPDIPTTTEVARAATIRNAVNLSDTALFGIYGSESDRRALVRLPNGRYEKVKVGDRLDGGRVLAIGETQLRYRKRGRTITLDLPRG